MPRLPRHPIEKRCKLREGERIYIFNQKKIINDLRELQKPPAQKKDVSFFINAYIALKKINANRIVHMDMASRNIFYDATEALEMGLVNTVVSVKELEAETVAWAREMLRHSPMALRLLKAGLNAADDGLAGVQQLAGDATLLFYLTEEGQEGRNAFQEKRPPDFGRFPKRP